MTDSTIPRGTDDLNNQVRRIISETIASLEAIGCSNETALSLMVVQAAIRMRDSEKLRELRGFIDSLIDVEDTND